LLYGSIGNRVRSFPLCRGGGAEKKADKGPHLLRVTAMKAPLVALQGCRRESRRLPMTRVIPGPLSAKELRFASFTPARFGRGFTDLAKLGDVQ